MSVGAAAIENYTVVSSSPLIWPFWQRAENYYHSTGTFHSPYHSTLCSLHKSIIPGIVCYITTCTILVSLYIICSFFGNYISLTVPKRFKIFAHIVSGSILISCSWSCCVNAISHSPSCCCTEYRPTYDYPQSRDHSRISESMLLFSTTVTLVFSMILYVLVNQQAKSKPVQIWESSSTYLCPFWLHDLLLSWAGNIISFCQVKPHLRKRYHMRWSENTHTQKERKHNKKAW